MINLPWSGPTGTDLHERAFDASVAYPAVGGRSVSTEPPAVWGAASTGSKLGVWTPESFTKEGVDVGGDPPSR